jgi:hypothetical protein
VPQAWRGSLAGVRHCLKEGIGGLDEATVAPCRGNGCRRAGGGHIVLHRIKRPYFYHLQTGKNITGEFVGSVAPSTAASGWFERHACSNFSMARGRGRVGFRALKPVEGKANLSEKAGDRYFFAPLAGADIPKYW